MARHARRLRSPARLKRRSTEIVGNCSRVARSRPPNAPSPQRDEGLINPPLHQLQVHDCLRGLDHHAWTAFITVHSLFLNITVLCEIFPILH